MENTNTLKDKNAQEVVTTMVASILDGTVTEETLGLALKSLQINMAASLVMGQGKASEVANRLQKQTEKLLDRFDTLFDAEISKITEAEVALDMIERVHRIQLNTLEVQRKIVQGKDLFTTNIMSAEEKMINQLLNSFTSREDKLKFMDIVKEQLSKNSVNDSFDDENEPTE